MNIYLQTGTIIVFFALAAYSIGIITEQRTKKISLLVILFLTLGILLDITATAFMIIGSNKGGFTLHGLIGYSSLLGMLIDTLLMWRLLSKSGVNAPVPNQLHKFSRYAYLWWVIAFVTGGLLVMFN
ncbi:MAG: hypothetical protein KKF98_13630 [Bacteroidetes bacterium]|nr:hypothetical protein [Bacteroidota bacterium]